MASNPKKSEENDKRANPEEEDPAKNLLQTRAAISMAWCKSPSLTHQTCKWSESELNLLALITKSISSVKMEAEKAKKTKGTLNLPINLTKSLKVSSTLPTNNFNTMTKRTWRKFLKLRVQVQVANFSLSQTSIKSLILSIQGIKNPKKKPKLSKELAPESMRLLQKKSGTKN
jgi:hypothetical protein